MPDTADLLKRAQALPDQPAERPEGETATAPIPPASMADDPRAQALWSRAQRLPEQDTSRGTALFAGFWNNLVGQVQGVEQAAARMPSPFQAIGLFPGARAGQQRMIADIDRRIAEREQAYQQDPAVQQHPRYALGGQVAGAVAPSLVTGLAGAAGRALPGVGRAVSALPRISPILTAPTSLPGRAATAALAGGIGAAAQPVAGGDYWQQKAQQIGAGLATGGALGAAGGLIGPQLTQAQNAVMANFPNLARMVRGTEAKTPENFTRATINQVLEPLGITVPTNVKPGHEMVQFAGDRLENAYNQVLPRITFRPDAAFQQDLADLRAAASQTPHASQLDNIISRQIDTRLGASGTMDGLAFKRAESEISRMAHNYVTSQSGGERELGRLLYTMVGDMRDALTRANPQDAGALQNINSAWAMHMLVENAAGRRVDAKGVFNPTDLLMASRLGGGWARRQFGRGARLMQDFANAGSDVIKTGTISPGVLTRILASTVGGGLGHAVGGIPGTMLGAGVGAAVPSLAAGAQRLRQTPVARAMGQIPSRAATGAGRVAGDLITTPPP